MLTYLHPISGALALAWLVYVGVLGLRIRNDRRRSREWRQRHARLATPAALLILLSWPAGLATTWAWRADLVLADSAHFGMGGALVLLVAGSWISSRFLNRRAVRELHPWFGVAAMLVGAAQLFFGLQITP